MLILTLVLILILTLTIRAEIILLLTEMISPFHSSFLKVSLKYYYEQLHHFHCNYQYQATKAL